MDGQKSAHLEFGEKKNKITGIGGRFDGNALLIMEWGLFFFFFHFGGFSK